MLGQHLVGQFNRLGLGDPNICEAGLINQPEVLGLRQRPGDAADIEAGRVAHPFGQLARGDDVGDAEPPARPEYPEHLGESRRLVGQQVQHAVADDHVDAARLDRQVLDLAQAGLDVGEAKLLGVGARLGDHVGRHVHPDHPTFRARPRAEQ